MYMGKYIILIYLYLISFNKLPTLIPTLWIFCTSLNLTVDKMYNVVYVLPFFFVLVFRSKLVSIYTKTNAQN